MSITSCKNKGIIKEIDEVKSTRADNGDYD